MEPRILQEACESGVSSGAFFAVLIVMIITSAAWIGFFVNGRYGCLPLVFIRFVNDKSFLAEYERRLDKVVEHDLKKKYHVGRKLGEGVTSQVYRIQERSSSTFFALKKIPLKGSASLQRAVEREIKILKKLRHHHVTTLHDVYQSPNRIWAVLEFVSGGDLYSALEENGPAFPEDWCRLYVAEIALALEAIHKLGHAATPHPRTPRAPPQGVEGVRPSPPFGG